MIDSALVALMSGLVDYAGLFPPASLQLEDAAVEFSQHRQDSESWMLGRFIIPVSALDQLASQEAVLRLDSVVELSVLVGGGPEETFADRLAGQLSSASRFAAKNGKFLISALEVRAPDLCRDPTTIARVIHGLLSESELQPAPQAFVELPAGPEWGRRSSQLLEYLRECPALGFKLRCGGLDANQFPSAERVARILWTVVHARIPFKATAGLHHPIRHFNPTVATKMHGFLNVFGGAMLAATNQDLSNRDLLDLIREESPQAFRLRNGRLEWRTFVATAQGIAQHRHRLTSFGSCSFDEPREDLRQLNLLPGQGAPGPVPVI